MNRSSRTLLAISLLLLAAAAPAPAHANLPAGLAVAERTWPSACAGRTTASLDVTLPERNAGGEATGLRPTWTGTEWEWRTEACEYTYGPNLSPYERCGLDIHEYLHLAREQADHTGLLAPAVLDPITAELCRHFLPAPRNLVYDTVRLSLPDRPSSWRITCTPVRPRMRCRATRARSVWRFSVRRTGDMITVGRVGARSF